MKNEVLSNQIEFRDLAELEWQVGLSSSEPNTNACTIGHSEDR